jgi:CelD/BcsL family acetyltransferase involved in cellulose biosynthesis
LELTLYRDEAIFDILRAEWNALLRRSQSDTIFLTWEWQATWWHYLGALRGDLYVLAARRDGRLIGILPLYLTQDPGGKTLQVVGCIEVSDYLDLIVESGQEQDVYAAFLTWLAGPEAPDWDLLDLCNQPAVSPAHVLLPEMARARGWLVDVLEEDVCPVITLPVIPSEAGPDAGWEAYLATLDKKQRHEIRRKLRRMDREAPGWRVRLVEGGSELPAAMDTFITLHRLSSPAKDTFMTEQMQAFFRAMAQVLAERGWLQLSFLEIAGQPVASYLCFDYANEILVYNSGYDPQASSQLSPGWVLLAEIIRYAIARGRARFDFLQGNEEYKYRFGGVDTQVYRTLIRRRQG